MQIKIFEEAVSAARPEPKGVKVSLELWRELKESGLIEMRDVTALGVVDLDFRMPFYKNTCLICDPELELEGISFKLPPNAT